MTRRSVGSFHSEPPERNGRLQVVGLRGETRLRGEPVVHAGDGVALFDEASQGIGIAEPDRQAPPCTQTRTGARGMPVAGAGRV